MIIVAEKINTSRKSIQEAVAQRDSEGISRIAREQAEAGAHFIDVNAGTFVDREKECLCWLVETVQQAVDLPLCLDSPSPDVLEAAVKLHRGEPMINSISLERERYDALLPVVTGHPCHVIALCMGQTAMPTTVEDRVSAGSEIIGRLTAKGVPLERIYIDPLIQPVSIDTRMGVAALGAIRKLTADFPGVNTVCGLSNISFGLPARSLLNRNFLALAMQSGLSAAILDPTDRKLMSTLRAVQLLLDQDEYCQQYIEAYQQDKLAG
mgnify:CR=1 FL=1